MDEQLEPDLEHPDGGREDALVLSAGFSEVGGEGTSLQAKLIEAVKKSGVRVNGPNCLGIFNLNEGVRTGDWAPLGAWRRTACEVPLPV